MGFDDRRGSERVPASGETQGPSHRHAGAVSGCGAFVADQHLMSAHGRRNRISHPEANQPELFMPPAESPSGELCGGDEYSNSESPKSSLPSRTVEKARTLRRGKWLFCLCHVLSTDRLLQSKSPSDLDRFEVIASLHIPIKVCSRDVQLEANPVPQRVPCILENCASSNPPMTAGAVA